MPNLGGITSAPYFFYRADTGVYNDAGTTLAADEDLIRQINDQSGNARNISQATVANRTLKRTGMVNGLPVVRFYGNLTQSFTLPDLSALTEGEIFIVMRRPPGENPTTTAAFTGLYSMGTSASNSHVPYLDGIIYDDFGSDSRKNTGIPTAPVDHWFVYNVVSKAGEWTSRINNVQHYTTATNTVGFPAAPKLGISFSGDYHFDGDIFAVVFYSTTLGSSDRTAVYNALAALVDIANNGNPPVGSVSQDANGWTVLNEGVNTRKFYVSTSGNDANSGINSTVPKATPSAAIALLREVSSSSSARTGKADWLLFKKGDTWTVTANFGASWAPRGASASEPMLIGSYGSGARPKFKCGVDNAMNQNADPEDNVYSIGLEFYAHTRDPSSPDFVDDTGEVGLAFTTNGTANNWLVEDCKITFFEACIVFTGGWTNVTIRRNILTDSYGVGPHSSGIYVDGTVGLLIEENLLDHNGWNETVVGANATIFNHNIYLGSDNNNVVVRYNIISNASSHGLQARAGRQVYGNLFMNNPVALLMAIGNISTGAGDYAQNNVIWGSRDIDGASRGNGIDINAANGLTISGNLFFAANQNSGSAINLHDAEGISGVTISGNITYDWNQAMVFDPTLVPGGVDSHRLNGLVVSGNRYSEIRSTRMVDHACAYSVAQETWSNDVYADGSSDAAWFSIAAVNKSFAQWVAAVEATASNVTPVYPDPTRSPGSYAGTQGDTATTAGFLAKARAQSKDSWDTDYKALPVVNYLRAGFGLAAIGGDPPVSTDTDPLSRKLKCMVPFA